MQDAALTTNIGWDLIHLLLPLLPASSQCIDDIARLGNPREVLLKATEALRLIDFDVVHDDNLQRNSAELAPKAELVVGLPSAASIKSREVETMQGDGLPLPVLQFNALIALLSIVHARIKTGHPSRFLSSTLQAILASFSRASTHIEEMIISVASFVKKTSGTKRPHLPPRMSTGITTTLSAVPTVADPEGEPEDSGQEEKDLQKRLLQSFLTHIIEELMLALPPLEDIEGFAWSSRLQEKLHPERSIPGKRTITQRYAQHPGFQLRSSTIGQLVALAQDLGISSEELSEVTMDTRAEQAGLPEREDDPPKSVSEIPLSKTGALFLFAARRAHATLLNGQALEPGFPIFPHHSTMVINFLGSPSSDTGSTSATLIDTLLFLGLFCLSTNAIGEPTDDEDFTRYLQLTTLISAQCPDPTLRYHAHYLASTVLRSNPSDVARLAFIRDTLEHCPYENLRTSAISWIKGEIIEANHIQSSLSDPNEIDNAQVSVFNTPVALDSLAPFLFPDLTQELGATDLISTWNVFRLNSSFYLASLNFYYLLLVQDASLHETLDIPALHTNNDVAGSFLHPLAQLSEKLKAALIEGGELRVQEGAEAAEMALGELLILDDALERVTDGVASLNRTRA